MNGTNLCLKKYAKNNMKLTDTQINSPTYWDGQYRGKGIDREKTLRQDEYLKIIGDDPWNRVIELGCGLSPFPLMAAEKYFISCGLDYAKETVARLKSRYPSVYYYEGDALKTEFPDNYFDAVVAGEIIEHLEDPIALLREMSRICINGGKIIISTAKVEFSDPEHLWEFTKEELLTEMKVFGKPVAYEIESQIFKGRKYIFGWCFNDKN